MFRSVYIDTLQKVTSENFRNFGEFARFTFDVMTEDLFGTGLWYTGFTCTDADNSRVLVSPGRLYFDGEGYYNDSEGGTTIDLLKSSPSINQVWVAILVSPTPVDKRLTDYKSTTFLVDTQSRQTVARQAPQEYRRWAEITAKVGIVAPEPDKPLPTSDACVVAYVRLDATGIREIVQAVENEAPNVVGLDRRLDENDQWRQATGSQIEALGATVASFQSQLNGTAKEYSVVELYRDLGRVKETLNLPDDYATFGSDHYLTNAGTDTLNVDYLATVEEGIRFPDAQISEAQLALLNQYDATVVNLGNLLFPKYVEQARLVSTGKDRSYNVSQFTFDNYSVVQKTMVRERIRVGTWYKVCTNSAWWRQNGATYDQYSGILRLANGETYEVFEGDRYIPGPTGATSAQVKIHKIVRIRQVWTDGFENVSYTDTLVTRSTATGSVSGQTFIAPQDGWLTSIGLNASKVVSTAGITLLILEVPENGQPTLTQVIGRIEKGIGTISATAETRFTPDQPIQTKKGARYAFVIVTAGAYEFWQTKNNKLANGSAFYITDGSWAQADPTYDFSFSLYYAKFDQTRTEVQLQPATLANGIANMDITAVGVVPEGTVRSYYAQVNGRWVNLSDFGVENPLLGLPPLVPLKVVFQGSVDNQPCLGVGANSKLRCRRPRSDYRHISDAKLMPVPTPVKRVIITLRLEGWRNDGGHTHVSQLRTGAGFATVVNPTSIEDAPAPEDPTALIRTLTFVTAEAMASWKLRQSGTTDNVLDCYHVSEMNYVSFVS